MRLRLSRDDRLWHLKSPDLPKAVSQSPRIQLALNSDTDCRFHKRKNIPKREPRQAPSSKPRQTIAKSAHLGEVAKSTGGRAVPDCRGGRTKKQEPPAFGQSLFLEPGKGMCPG